MQNELRPTNLAVSVSQLRDGKVARRAAGALTTCDPASCSCSCASASVSRVAAVRATASLSAPLLARRVHCVDIVDRAMHGIKSVSH